MHVDSNEVIESLLEEIKALHRAKAVLNAAVSGLEKEVKDLKEGNESDEG